MSLARTRRDAGSSLTAASLAWPAVLLLVAPASAVNRASDGGDLEDTLEDVAAAASLKLLETDEANDADNHRDRQL